MAHYHTTDADKTGHFKELVFMNMQPLTNDTRKRLAKFKFDEPWKSITEDILEEFDSRERTHFEDLLIDQVNIVPDGEVARTVKQQKEMIREKEKEFKDKLTEHIQLTLFITDRFIQTVLAKCKKVGGEPTLLGGEGAMGRRPPRNFVSQRQSRASLREEPATPTPEPMSPLSGSFATFAKIAEASSYQPPVQDVRSRFGASEDTTRRVAPVGRQARLDRFDLDADGEAKSPATPITPITPISAFRASSPAPIRTEYDNPFRSESTTPFRSSSPSRSSSPDPYEDVTGAFPDMDDATVGAIQPTLSPKPYTTSLRQPPSPLDRPMSAFGSRGRGTSRPGTPSFTPTSFATPKAYTSTTALIHQNIREELSKFPGVDAVTSLKSVMFDQYFSYELDYRSRSRLPPVYSVGRNGMTEIVKVQQKIDFVGGDAVDSGDIDILLGIWEDYATIFGLKEIDLAKKDEKTAKAQEG